MCLDRAMTTELPKSELRKRLEVLSTPLLLKINSMPRAITPLVIVGALLIGLFNPGVVGGLAILFVAAFIGWLLFLSWPLLEVRAKALRLAVLLMILTSAVAQIMLAK